MILGCILVVQFLLAIVVLVIMWVAGAGHERR